MQRVDLHVAATICGVKPGTIRKWVFDKVIVRYPDGYDVYELLHWVDARSTDALMVRAGIAGQHADELRRRSA